MPLRYARDDLDQIVTSTPSNPSLRVPFIDMNKLVNLEFHEKELQKLHFACHELVGSLFQVINTRILGSTSSWGIYYLEISKACLFVGFVGFVVHEALPILIKIHLL